MKNASQVWEWDLAVVLAHRYPMGSRYLFLGENAGNMPT